MPETVFITGGTGYVGRALIPLLVARGHRVIALVRPGSAGRVPAGAETVEGNALDSRTFAVRARTATVLVQLVGTPHPAPWKAAEFVRVDEASLRASVDAVAGTGIHFVYLSVAHPAPSMKAYVATRIRCEEYLAASGLRRTILRPWYVLGPGHRWPYVLLPFYKLAAQVPGVRAGALRLGLVTLREMALALVNAVENASDDAVIDVPGIRRAGGAR
ncbi:MAG: NAD-dependent epimerase/dehydratase family protein [Acidobacteria bacterium]|nr:NAD-dependent epimerase/dehydratase family protein [Acidobacteriota bacterium]